MNSNYWSEFEYNKNKLILNSNKVNNILENLNNTKEFDEIPPISIELHLTDNCNLNCPWCTDGILRKNLASLEKNVIFELFDYCSENNIGVTIEGGGEPSIHKDFEEIIQYGNKINLDMGLISNGVKDYSKLINLFKWVRISLDATNEEQYKIEKGFDKFNKVLSNIKEFNKNRNTENTHFGIGYVLTKRNMDGILDIIEYLDNVNVDYMYIRPVEEAEDICPSLSELYDLKKQIIEKVNGKRIKILFSITERYVQDNDNLPCIAHSLTCIVNANGNVMLCEKRRHDPVVFGNLNEQGFEQIWESQYRQNISKKLKDKNNQKGCAVCRITSFNKMFYDLSKINTKKFI